MVYGHTPVPEPEWLNRTTNIDTGCVFGGKLTALRWPEREFVSVPALKTYCEPARPFLPTPVQQPAFSSQQLQDDLLDAEDVLGKRIISDSAANERHDPGRERHRCPGGHEPFCRQPQVADLLAAYDVALRNQRPGRASLNTRPRRSRIFASQGVAKIVCEEKHMGSRAVVIVCRDEQTASERFGVVGESGIVYTRTGRRFFSDPSLETQFLARIRSAMDASGFWSQFNTAWACLDCELMPWSAKAQELLRSQYAAVGAAGRAALPKAVELLQQAADRLSTADSTGNSTYSSDVTEILRRFQNRGKAIERFVDAYRQYCWPVASLDDLKLAPFHLLATEGKVHADQNHVWHMETLAAICRHDPGILVENAVQDRRPGRARRRRVWRKVVAGIDWQRWGRHGGQAARISS